MWFDPWESFFSAELQEKKVRFFFNNFHLCLILKIKHPTALLRLLPMIARISFWPGVEKKSRDTLDSREIPRDSHFRSWPNVTLFKRPISTFFQRTKLRFIKKRALNFHFFWSWCVHDDQTTQNQPSDNYFSFHCQIFESGSYGRYRTRCRSQTRTNKLSKIRQT